MKTALSRLRKWLFFFLLVGALVLATFLAIAATQPGDTFLDRLNALLEEANSGGLVTLEKAHVIRYLHSKSAGKT